jgi:RNA polymerase sigma-70 factor (ECF subfamily)
LDPKEKLYRENYARIRAFLFRLCGDPLLAEDLAQETFYQAFISLHRFKGESEVFTWLASIARHMYLKYLRSRKMTLEAADLELVVDSFCSSAETPEEQVQRHCVEDAVRRVIRTIPPKYRDVVLLRVYAELPFAQVAKALKISENSAKVIYCRAKKMLAEELKNEFEL